VKIDGEGWGSQERSTLLLGLLDAVAQGSLEASLFVRCVKDMEYFNGTKSYYELGDILWMTWLLHGLGNSCSEEEKQGAGERLVEAAVNLVQEGLLSRQILMELSDGDFMEAAGLVNSYKDGWRKREIRLNTRNVYAQRKYNLLREESEGYSKVITLLNQSGAAKVSDDIMERILTELKSLIGYFDLDPNRVSSLILDAFAAQPHNIAFISLIKGFGVYKCVEFLKFRFSSGDGMDVGVFKASALMVKSGLVSLEDIVGHLQPGDQEYAALVTARDVHLKTSVGKIGIISLTSSDNAEDGQALRKSGQTAKTIILDTRSYRKILASHYDVSESGDAESGKNSESMVDQRLEFLAELLACNAWDEALLFCKYLQKMGMTDIAAHDRIGRYLCRVLVEEIDNNSSEISDKASEALCLVGCHLHFDLRALRRVLGVVSRMYSADPDRAQSILLETVLPAYNLVPSNVELSTAFWNDLLSKLPYTERFCLYAEFEDVVKRSPLLQASEKLAETEIRRILRRVTAPTNKKEAKLTMRPIARLLAKISHANPFVICRQLLRQVMGMPGMVLSISESLKYLTPLTFDVLTFTILKQLSSGKRKLKEDGVNLEEWFQWLALFTGVVCRNQHGMEVTSLVQYIVNQLKGSDSMDLLVLREIISTMTRISPTVDVSNQQLDALAGSDALIQYVIGQEEGGRESGGKKDTTRATSRLVTALKQGCQNDHLLLPLLILLAQQRKLIALHPPSKHLKLAAELVDKCEEVTMQYIEFLQKSLPETEYATTMPSIEELMMEYKIDPEIVLQIHRPMLRKVTPCALLNGDNQDEEGEIDTDHAGAEEGQQDHAPISADWVSVQQLLTNLAPADGFVGMSWEMFVCFWAYELSDLCVPVERYDSVLKQVELSRRNLQDDIAAKRDMPKGGHWGSTSGGAHITAPQVDIGALKSELASLDALVQVLPSDLGEQRRNATAVAWIFQQSSASWYALFLCFLYMI
jgi:THO complex subunit 2